MVLLPTIVNCQQELYLKILLILPSLPESFSCTKIDSARQSVSGLVVSGSTLSDLTS